MQDEFKSHKMNKNERHWYTPPLMWLILLVGAILFISSNLELDRIINQQLLHISGYIENSKYETTEEFVVKTSGCRIPNMKAMDPSVAPFIFEKEPLVCRYGKPPLVDSNATSLFIVEEAVNFYSTSFSGIDCCYRPFWRKEPRKDRGEKFVLKMGAGCEPFGRSIDVPHEFVRVTCKKDGKEIYKDYFAFVPLKKFAKQKGANEQLNVLMIGMDGLSRLNFIRQMPKTYEFLKKISAFEFKGYNKIGDNTYPNLIAALTGRDEGEIINTCWNKTTFFDACPFIWEKFQKKGLVTLYAEDNARIGSFQYCKKGFKKQPTDYYWLFFDEIAERRIGNTKSNNVNYCLGGRFVHEVILNYTKRFVDSMEIYKRRYFSFTWINSISHDHLNKPKIADEYYYSTLRDLHAEGSLDHTVLFLWSDHGIRWGKIRSTYQGMLEERLPLLMLRLPPWFTTKYPLLTSRLTANSKQLVTPFDVHATLEDLVEPSNIANKIREQSKRKAYSLFEMIPENRSCSDAGIGPHWCTCQESIPIPVNERIVVSASEFTVRKINADLRTYTECASLSLDKIFEARLQTHKMSLQKEINHTDYTINFRTRPNGALYEATVRHFYSPRDKFEVSGTISRLNLYLDQSRCITDYRMKLYCYCNDLFNEIQ